MQLSRLPPANLVPIMRQLPPFVNYLHRSKTIPTNTPLAKRNSKHTSSKLDSASLIDKSSGQKEMEETTTTMMPHPQTLRLHQNEQVSLQDPRKQQRPEAPAKSTVQSIEHPKSGKSTRLSDSLTMRQPRMTLRTWPQRQRYQKGKTKRIVRQTKMSLIALDAQEHEVRL